MQYVEFNKRNGQLVISLTPAGKQEIEEAIADGKNIDSDAYMYELFEHPLCNGWFNVAPEEIGALTNAPIFSDNIERDDDGNVVNVDCVYAYMDYAVRSPVEVLREKGEVIFSRHDCLANKA